MVKPVERVYVDLRYKYQCTRDMYGFRYVFFFLLFTINVLSMKNWSEQTISFHKTHVLNTFNKQLVQNNF